MHDYHAVKALIDHLHRELGPAEIVRVTAVRIRVDSTLSPEALAQSYEMLTEGTPLEGSRLFVETPPDERWCHECGTSWTATHDDVAGHLLVCPSCGALTAIEGTGGLEVLEVVRTTAA